MQSAIKRNIMKKEDMTSMARTVNVFVRVESEVKEQAEQVLAQFDIPMFNVEIEKGMDDIKAGRVYSADEVEAEMKREFGI